MKKIFIAIFLVTSLNLNVVGAHAGGTSIASAKSLVRTLYYGHQQAVQRSMAAGNKYIVDHLYPGMYSNPMQCLINLENQSGMGYGKAVPSLTTIDRDPTWTVPTGLPLNKMSGKKPKGDTFVLDVNWPDGVSTNHVTILNGKPYYYLWVCGS